MHIRVCLFQMYVRWYFNLSWKLFKNITDTKYNHTAFLVNVATSIYSYIGSNYKNVLLFINTLVPRPCLNSKLKVIQYWDFVKNSRNRLVNTRFETLLKIVLWEILWIMTNFLNNRKYRVVLNDQNSPWKKLKLEFLLVLF